MERGWSVSLLSTDEKTGAALDVPEKNPEGLQFRDRHDADNPETVNTDESQSPVGESGGHGCHIPFFDTSIWLKIHK
jgi:hypothetical protein